jgi:hypothetical protein
MIKRHISPVHHIGAMTFMDGPASLDADAWYQEDGPFACQWTVSLDIFPHEVDRDNPNQWDADNEQIIPESALVMTRAETRDLIALLTEVVEAVELFQAGEEFREDD